MADKGYFFWLASFPRSGNTFVRNILYNVFGLESSTYDINEGKLLEDNYLDYPVIKTHMLPSQLMPGGPHIKAIYLVRDGRDAMVSIAHHRSDIVVPGSDFLENMRAAIYAEKGSFFGGWSRNVQQWMERAGLIIRFEELITDPVACMEQLRHYIGLPKGDYSKIPRFDAMKYGMPKYGSGRERNMTEEEKRTLAEHNFRRGKSGAWQDEMPEELHDLFWSIHGETMLKLGYQYDGSISPASDPDLAWELIPKLNPCGFVPPEEKKKIRVLIEADKLLSPVNDGVKRYLVTLLREWLHVHRNPFGRWHFDLFFQGRQPVAITEMASLINEPFTGAEPSGAMTDTGLIIPLSVKIQQRLLKGIPSGFKEWLVRRNIMVLHRLFDGYWRFAHRCLQAGRWLLRIIKRSFQWLLFWLTGSSPGAHQEAGGVYDLIHLSLQHHYLPFQRTRSPLIATIHDFTHRIYPVFHTPANVRNAERGWHFVLRRANRIIAVSSSTAADAVRFSKARQLPADVICEAIDRTRFHHKINSDDRKKVCRKYGIPEGIPFFLTLSSIEPRKNLEGVIQAFFEMVSRDTCSNLLLVVAGKRSWGRFHPHTLAGFNPDKVVFTSFVDDEDLPALYSEALAFCYVSHYEGFGLPLLEALNCGTPVIYGDNSSMVEIAGDAGLAADASDFRDISRQMARVFYNEDLRKSLVMAARKQAAHFSTTGMARQTLDAYERSVGNLQEG